MRVRSGYSFKTAYGHLKDVASRLEEIGWERQPISDRGSTFAFNRWSHTVPAPIYGVELAVVEEISSKRTSMDYWTFFAKDKLRDLHALVGLATRPDVKEPTLDYTSAIKAKGVIKIIGEYGQLDKIGKKIPADLYVALSPGMPLGLYKEAKKRKFKFIAVSDNYYPRATDQETYRIALGKRSATQTFPLYILSDEEWHEAVDFASKADRMDAIKNRKAAMKLCKAKLTTATLVQPERLEPLRKMCEFGAGKLGVDLRDPVSVYSARLTRELDMIEEKNFEDYFYIIADVIAWSKERMLVGPARGSSCGSLVCYLLGITTVDPIKYNLIFERFIDVNRNDLPDIDIDFSDRWRFLAFEYMEKKFGRERTARLGTVGTFGPRSALNAAGKALQLDKFRIEKVLDSLIVRNSGDSRALQTMADTLTDTATGKAFVEEFPEILAATALEGHPTAASQHAAGMVLTQEPIDTYVAVDERSGSAMCDKKDAEELGMLKIDMLGLTQLSIFERTLELIGVMDRPDNYGGQPIRLKDGRRITDYFTALPLDDPAAFDVINDRHYSGIFQFNGHALQSIANIIHTDTIEDVIAMTALARPGPMASGGTNKWCERRAGREPITYPHPIFKPYIEGTLGIVTYQEQVMQIGREVGDLSWDDVTQLRKAMSRSLGKEYFDRFGDRWKENAIKKGVPREVTTRIWDELCAYGSWAFNRAHAVAYGLVSYWCCYLKAHHPSEFAAATLDAEHEPTRQLMFLRELQREGINYLPVDIHNSTDRWAINSEGTLIGPLTSIKRIGPAAVREILDARVTGKPLRASVAKLLDGKRTDLDSLYPVSDAINRLHPDLTAINIFTPVTPCVDIQVNGTKQSALVVGVVTRVTPRDANEAVNIAKRGGRIAVGQTASLNIWIRDDSEELFCKISTRDYVRLGGDRWLEEIRIGRTLLALKGNVPEDFRMLWISGIRKLGEMDDGLDKTDRNEDEQSDGYTAEAAE